MMKRYQKDDLIMMVFTMTGVFSLFTTSLSGFHLYLILQNKSTVECDTLDNYNPFNVGSKDNWEQIFGTKKWKWFLPIESENAITGLEYPEKNHNAQMINSLI